MDVSIIIVNYNTRDLTLQCLRSVYEKTKNLEFETIVVDNASSDDSAESIKKEFPQVRVVESDENLGFGRANNLGYEYANGKYIFLLNSDTLLLNNAIKLFFDFLEESDDKIACAGTVLLGKDGKPVHSCARFPTVKRICKQLLNHYTSFLFGWDIAGYDLYLNEKQFPKVVDYITGADLFLKKEVVEKFGFFNPQFFMYYEETELQYRYHSAGYLSVLIGSPQIVHLHGIGKKKRTLRGWYMSTEGCFTYCKQVFSKKQYYAVRAMYFLFLLPIIVCYPTCLKDKLAYLKLLLNNV